MEGPDGQSYPRIECSLRGSSESAQVDEQIIDVVFPQVCERRHPTVALFRQRRKSFGLEQDRCFNQYGTTPGSLGSCAMTGRAIFCVPLRSGLLVAVNCM